MCWNHSTRHEEIVTTPTVKALRAELAKLREDMTALRPDTLRREDLSLLKAKEKALETLVRRMEAKGARQA